MCDMRDSIFLGKSHVNYDRHVCGLTRSTPPMLRHMTELRAFVGEKAQMAKRETHLFCCRCFFSISMFALQRTAACVSFGWRPVSPSGLLSTDIWPDRLRPWLRKRGRPLSPVLIRGRANSAVPRLHRRSDDTPSLHHGAWESVSDMFAVLWQHAIRSPGHASWDSPSHMKRVLSIRQFLSITKDP